MSKKSRHVLFLAFLLGTPFGGGGSLPHKKAEVGKLNIMPRYETLCIPVSYNAALCLAAREHVPHGTCPTWDWAQGTGALFALFFSANDVTRP